MTTEIWKDVVGYEGLYQVSDNGNIQRLPYESVRSDGKPYRFTESPIKLRCHKSGYLRVALSKNFKRHYFLVHRIVATAFIPNPDNKKTVNHKNGIKTDNCVDNLEWATYSENEIHSFRTLGKKPSSPWKGKFANEHCNSKSVTQYLKDGTIVNTFCGISEASRLTGISLSSISQACGGKAKTAGGFIWKYNNPA